jgi:hypothetical protein
VEPVQHLAILGMLGVDLDPRVDKFLGLEVHDIFSVFEGVPQL